MSHAQRPTRPTVEMLEAFAADRGVGIPVERLRLALEMHVKFRSELDRLRDVPLQYVPDYVEPATALRWIENGGRFP